MKKINKYENIIVDKYTEYNEDERFSSKHQRVEYLTTMRYIKKYAEKGAKILEIGAGTGAYSVALAKEGYNVTAVELVQKNLDIMKQNASGIKNITCLQGDALDLSRFADNSFDIVLNFGPMYHLFNQKDKNKAISESIRVCKSNGICMFAYLTHSSIVWAYGVRKNKLANVFKCMNKDGSIKDIPEEIFTSFYVEDFKKLFKRTNTTHLKDVATDGLFSMMRDNIDALNDEDYNNLLNWHFTTCERPDHLGYSSHMLCIVKKN